MQILASSIEKASEAFLHAGYISAYPREFEAYGYNTVSGVQYEVAEALRLEGETLASHIPSQDFTSLLAAVTGSGDWLPLALGCAGFFGALAGAYAVRQRLGGAPRLVGQIAACLIAVLCLAAATCSTSGPEPLPDEAPWEGVEIRDYANPEDATFVILNGIIADGIINVGQAVETLPNIQNEVGLPASTLTEGQAYALKTYGLDGWGREMRLDREGNAYTVTSAGADGAFDSEDDISVTVAPCNNETWDVKRHAFFLREHEGSLLLFFHRWTGSHFLYRNPVEASELTGGELYDFLTTEDMYEELRSEVQTTWDEATDGLAHEPMVLQIADSPY